VRHLLYICYDIIIKFKLDKKEKFNTVISGVSGVGVLRFVSGVGVLRFVSGVGVLRFVSGVGV
jgi:hypothetical protein